MFKRKCNDNPSPSDSFSLQAQVELMKVQLADLKRKIDEQELSIWMLHNISTQKPYHLVYRDGDPMYKGITYEPKVRDLEERGFVIKRVSDCGKYELWMKPETKSV